MLLSEGAHKNCQAVRAFAVTFAIRAYQEMELY